MNYYNEHDRVAAAWLRALIADGQIAEGIVDERSIVDVQPGDLVDFVQCHFFAGIGGWSLALRLAGWPDDRPVWTGSCPCQPFSAAGTGTGTADARHLWPHFYRLIRERRPVVVFGEQVEAAIRHGWLDLVCDDLEREGYAVGAVGLPAASVGAPHIRQRLWFVADRDGARRGTGRPGEAGDGRDTPRVEPAGLCDVGVALGDANIEGSQGRLLHPERAGERVARTSGVAGELADDTRDGRREECPDDRRIGAGNSAKGWTAGLESSGDASELADTGLQQRERRTSQQRPTGTNATERDQEGPDDQRGESTSFWSACDWLPCRDGKSRPVEPGTFPLAHGVSGRVGRLRGYGNAIVPHVAAAVIEAFVESHT